MTITSLRRLSYYTKRPTLKNNTFRHNKPLYAATTDNEPTNTMTRGNTINYVAKWQERGDHYISYINLQNLNDQLIKYDGGYMSNEQKRKLASELTLTYFARLHNIIREEYQYEKSLVEERLQTWPINRLKNEGYTIFNLLSTFKGSLYQDNIYRFHLRDYELLPFHKFSVGDSIRISNKPVIYTNMNGNNNNNEVKDSFIDGIVLDRRSKYLDIAIKSTDSKYFERRSLAGGGSGGGSERGGGGGGVYRLDTFLNRVSYDRMVESLQVVLSPQSLISRTLRDLILYRYTHRPLSHAYILLTILFKIHVYV